MDEREYLARIGKEARRLRMELKLSQFKLGSAMGVDQANLSRIENGTQGMQPEMLIRLCSNLNVSIGEFMQLAFGDCTAQEKTLIHALRVADPGMRQILLDVANAAIIAAEANKHAITNEEKAA